MQPRRITGFILCVLIGMTSCNAARRVGVLAPTEEDTAYQTSLKVFNQRILPIFRSPNPSSCSECHLSGVDLKNYLRESPEETFVSLRDQGLVNLENPAQSKIMDFIRMGNPQSQRLTQETRKAELEAFQAWLEASAKSVRLVNLPRLADDAMAKPPTPVEVIRHAREDRVYDSFLTNVWSQIERCAGCHSQRNPDLQKLMEQHGTAVHWCGDSAEQTYRNILERRLVNAEKPLESLLLMKPTMQVEHGGGKKMEIGDLGYKQFRQWLEDYAAVTSGAYQTAEELPRTGETEYVGSEIWLKVAPTPDMWADKILGVLIYPFDAASGQFSETPVATSDRRVWGGGKLWQHNLILMAPRGSDLAREFWKLPELPAGRYLIRFYCDATGELEKDWRTELNSSRFFVGETVTESKWQPGYDRMTVLTAPVVAAQ